MDEDGKNVNVEDKQELPQKYPLYIMSELSDGPIKQVLEWKRNR